MYILHIVKFQIFFLLFCPLNPDILIKPTSVVLFLQSCSGKRAVKLHIRARGVKFCTMVNLQIWTRTNLRVFKKPSTSHTLLGGGELKLYINIASWNIGEILHDGEFLTFKVIPDKTKISSNKTI